MKNTWSTADLTHGEAHLVAERLSMADTVTLEDAVSALINALNRISELESAILRLRIDTQKPMKTTRFAQESAAQAQSEAQQSEPEKPKLVQIALSDSHLYALASDGRLFEACMGTGRWRQLTLPHM